ncbi:MAG: flagellar biosynthesis anti-sigma factor FlgM [Planctomycetota bacterium]
MKKDPSETPEGAMEKLPVLSLSNIWTLARAMKYEPRVRMDKIQEVRARIAEGHYDDPEKVDATVDAILNDIELIEMARSKAIEIRQDREAAQRQREKRVVLTAGPSV